MTKSLVITVKSPNSSGIHVTRGTRLLDSCVGESGRFEIPGTTLGRGHLMRIQVIGLGDKDPKSWVFAPPIDITVEE